GDVKRGFRLSEAVGLRIPEVAVEAEAREDRPHLRRLRPARDRLEPGCIPGGRQTPELIQADEGADREPFLLAPLANPFFRPEEEHVASGEDDVVPPVRRGYGAMEEPVGGFGTL